MTRYNDEQLASFPWIVSCDTLKTETLLVKFWSTAEQLGIKLSDSLVADLTLLVGDDSIEADWNDALAAESVTELAEALDCAAPDGFQFSVQDGDGACFGFWLQDEWVEAFEHMGLGDADHNAELIAELIAGGIEPETIEDSFLGQVEGVTEERAGAAYAQQTAEDCGIVPQSGQTPWPLYCIDWEQAWRELRFEGHWLQSTGGGDWLVFRSV